MLLDVRGGEVSMILVDRIAAIENVVAKWCSECPEFLLAVVETERLQRYPRAEVARQLQHIVRGFTSTNMLHALERQVPGYKDAPGSIAHLAAAAVPGLAIESLLWGLVLGSINFVRPATEERCIQQFVALIQRAEPELSSLIHLTSDIDWRSMDAAIVYGSDETIEFIQERLPLGARIAAFGSRSGVAIADNAVDLFGFDITAFDQRGCMCPTVLLTVGDEKAHSEILNTLTIELHSIAQSRLFERTADERFAAACRARHTMDTLTFDAIISNTEIPLPVVTELSAVGVIHCESEEDVKHHLRNRGTSLQTVVLGIRDQNRRERMQLIARGAGASRVCNVGESQFPLFEWPHDGIGHIAPLVG